MEVRLFFNTDRPLKEMLNKENNEGLALETYALKPLQGGQFTCLDSVDGTNFFFGFHSRKQHH